MTTYWGAYKNAPLQNLTRYETSLSDLQKGTRAATLAVTIMVTSEDDTDNLYPI